MLTSDLGGTGPIPCPFCREYDRSRMSYKYGKLCSRHLAECAVPARLYSTLNERPKHSGGLK